MKSLLALLLALTATGAVRAQQVNDGVPLQQGFCTIGTNYALGNTTNATLVTVETLQVDWALYHTFQSYTATNAMSVAIDKSLDGTNWVLGTTNAIAVGVASETTITGKYLNFRVRASGTNLLGAGVNYLGGR